jgi:hypothetical protein
MGTDVNMGTLDSECKHLMENIERWRRESIEKVEQAAEEARRKVLDILNVNRSGQLNQLLQCRNVFTSRLQQAEREKDFHETHLKYWYQFLEDLQHNFNRYQASCARLEHCTKPFISKIVIHESPSTFRYTKWCSYERDCIKLTDIRQSQQFQEQNSTPLIPIEPCESSYSGNVDQAVNFRQIKPCQEQNYYRYSNIEPYESSYPWIYGQIGDLTPYAYRLAYLNGPRELWTGEYQFRLSTGLLFIGIISKHADTRSILLNTRSVYGWNGDDVVYLNGVPERGYRGYQSNMQRGDIISLIVNCEQKIIRLKNFTKNTTDILDINTDKCPLPWLLKVRFFELD